MKISRFCIAMLALVLACCLIGAKAKTVSAQPVSLSIPIGKQPAALAMSPDGSSLWVANQGD
ncbi:MAG: hypothetical protein WCJ28_03135, partial [Actinomycetota bacterium]